MRLGERRLRGWTHYVGPKTLGVHYVDQPKPVVGPWGKHLGRWAKYWSILGELCDQRRCQGKVLLSATRS